MYNMSNEIWKDVVGYEGFYKVSNMGRVYSIRKKIIMRPNRTHKGYRLLGLTNKDGRKTKSVHRAVMEAFVPNPENKPTVNHKDLNKQNNHVDNLEWATHKERRKRYKCSAC